MQTAAVPLSALTAWQALFGQAGLSAGQTVLVHGAAGGVGHLAVQLSCWAGARVTASARHRDFVRSLGAFEVIDYSPAPFEELAHGVDVVLDTVGGDTLARSWSVLRPGGTLVSVGSRPSAEQAAAHGARGAFFIVQASHDQLLRIGELIDAGQICPAMGPVLSLAEARLAYGPQSSDRAPGKTILQVLD
jgi:NADPH:quinone reductase-like Zn-dependent oxidoreductase